MYTQYLPLNIEYLLEVSKNKNKKHSNIKLTCDLLLLLHIKIQFHITIINLIKKYLYY